MKKMIRYSYPIRFAGKASALLFMMAAVSAIAQEVVSPKVTNMIPAVGAQQVSIKGIFGGVICGTYSDTNSNTIAFTYTGTNYSTFTPAVGALNISFQGLAGETIYGQYEEAETNTNAGTITPVIGPGDPNTGDQIPSGETPTNIAEVNYTMFAYLCIGTNCTTLTPVSGAEQVSITGVNGKIFYGGYSDTNFNKYGYSYDGTNYGTILPATGAKQVTPEGISGNILYGTYIDTNTNLDVFTYDGTNYTTIKPATNASSLFVEGYSNNTLYGEYEAEVTNTNTLQISYSSFAFLCKGTNCVLLSPATGAMQVGLDSYSGSIFYGSYMATNGTTYGFTYNGTHYTTISPATNLSYLDLYGIGNTIVGQYGQSLTNTNTFQTSFVAYSFICNGTNCTTLSPTTGAQNVSILGFGGGGLGLAPGASNVITFYGNYEDAESNSYCYSCSGTNYGSILPTTGVKQVQMQGFTPIGIYGVYCDSNSNWDIFLYRGNTNYSTIIPAIGEVDLRVFGILSNTVYGNYYDTNHNSFAFSAVLPSTNVVTPKSQTINFVQPSAKTYAPGGTFMLAATALGGTVSFSSSNTNVIVISGDTATILAAGNSVIMATQGGDETYAPAKPVSRTVKVNKANQIITFPQPPSQSLSGDRTFPLTANAPGGSVTYASSNPSVISVSGSSATIHKIGTAKITASVTANSDYNAAPSVTVTVTVTK